MVGSAGSLRGLSFLGEKGGVKGGVRKGGSVSLGVIGVFMGDFVGDPSAEVRGEILVWINCFGFVGEEERSKDVEGGGFKDKE